MKTHHKANGWHFLSLTLSQLMVAINIVGSKHLLTHLSSLFILNARFIIAAVFLLFTYLVSRTNTWHSTKTLLCAITAKVWLIIIAQALCAGILFNFRPNGQKFRVF